MPAEKKTVMDKATFEADLDARPWVEQRVGDPVLVETKPGGIKWYNQNVMEIVGKAAIFRNIPYYVVDEGLPTESIFYKDREPEQTIKEPEVQPAP